MSDCETSCHHWRQGLK
jgi:hypothetical protein